MIDEKSRQFLCSCPRLTRHASFTQRKVRQCDWVFLQNDVSGACVRLTLPVWQSIQDLNGELSLTDWLATAATEEESSEWMTALLMLKRHGLLEASEQAFYSYNRNADLTSGQRRFNPLLVRIPLCHPDKWFEWLSDHLAALPVKRVKLAFYALLLAAITALFTNTAEFAYAWKQLPSDPTQWWRYALLFPVLKLIHECAHGIALHRAGGKVTQAGITFLVLFPLPYVDATDSWRLTHRSQRLTVVGAGIIADIMMAALAVLVWSIVSDGLAREIAFSTFILSTISVLVFNGNPLLKFDGYYLLEEFLDSPSLATRSTAYYRHLFRRFLFGVDTAMGPVVAEGERRWLLIYGLLSSAYRYVISFVIIVFLVNELHEIGLLLALFVVWQLLMAPLLRFSRYLFTSPELKSHRARAFSMATLIPVIIWLLVFVTPLPSSTRVEGITWVPEQAQIYSSAEGIVRHWHVNNGDKVFKGQRLLSLESPDLPIQLERNRHEQTASRQLAHQYRLTDPLRVQQARIELSRLLQLEQHLVEQQQKLTIHAPSNGRIAIPENQESPGIKVKNGDLLAYVISPGNAIVKAVVTQNDIGRLTDGVEDSEVRLAGRIRDPLPATIIRQPAAGKKQLPSPALADSGYGGIAVDSSINDTATRHSVFELLLALKDDSRLTGIGAKAYVTLSHKPEPIGHQWFRQFQQLLIKHLNV